MILNNIKVDSNRQFIKCFKISCKHPNKQYHPGHLSYSQKFTNNAHSYNQVESSLDLYK